jgi:carboxyl-terminal processing protease
MDANRKILMNTYKNAATFNASFYVNEGLWNKFVTYIKQYNTTDFSSQEINQSEKHVRLLIKAMIARQVWRDEGYYTVLSSEDKMIRKAIETFSSNYNKLLRP